MTVADKRGISVRYFAAVREAVGLSEERIETAAPNVAALRHELAARGGAWADVLGAQKMVRTAVDHVMVPEDTSFEAGSEVAFFPPVTGG